MILHQYNKVARVLNKFLPLKKTHVVCDYVMPYHMTHDGYVLGIFGSYLDFHIIWFGISVLCHGCNVLKVLGIIKR